jgi:hypothetical protein
MIDNKVADFRTMQNDFQLILKRDELKKPNMPKDKPRPGNMRGTTDKKLDHNKKRLQEEAQKQLELLKRERESVGDKKITREIKY